MNLLVDGQDLHSDRGTRHVLKGLDLAIHPGEIVGLIGENGSGKSTLARILSGTMRPTSGSLTFEGQAYVPESAGAAAAAGVSMIEQDPDIPPTLTVAEAIHRHTPSAGKPRADLARLAGEIMARTNFVLPLDAQISSLTPSEHAVVEVLRVVAEDPRLLILDESSDWLHDLDIVHLHEVLRQVRERGGSVIYVGHRLEEVLAISDRVAVLRGGRISQVLEARRTTREKVIDAMFGHQIEAEPKRSAAPAGDLHLSVRGLQVDTKVHDVDLDLHRHEIIGVIGLRDSGAHELVEALAGQRPSTVRSVVHAGETHAALKDVQQRVAYLPAQRTQDDEPLSKRLTTGSNIKFEWRKRREAKNVAYQLRLTTKDMKAPVNSLSGGERQKISVAATVAIDSDLIVLSYPTRGVDIGTRGRVYGMIDRARTQGGCVVFQSTNVHELLDRCDRVLVLHQGRNVALLETGATHEDQIMDYVMTGESTPPRSSGRRGRRGA